MRWLPALCVALAVPATAQDESGDIDLDVQPKLCIVDRRTPACDMDFLVEWRSVATGDYCLFGQQDDTPLRCWAAASDGRHAEQRRISESFRFWMTPADDDEPLASVTVEVMSADAGDRRRRRHSRHVWDIL